MSESEWFIKITNKVCPDRDEGGRFTKGPVAYCFYHGENGKCTYDKCPHKLKDEVKG